MALNAIVQNGIDPGSYITQLIEFVYQRLYEPWQRE